MRLRRAEERTPHALTRAESEALGRRILEMTSVPEAEVQLHSLSAASTHFARGDAQMSSARTEVTVVFTAAVEGKLGQARGNRLDDRGLQTLVLETEAAAHQQVAPGPSYEFLGPQRYLTSCPRFFDGVGAAMAPERRAAVMARALDVAEAAGVVAAGDLHFGVHSRAVMNTKGLFSYAQGTGGEFSVTARTQDGRGSGWAWDGREDWAKVDTEGVAARAVSLAQRSANPAAVEPGRYTVILEPPAVAELIEQVILHWGAARADGGGSVFSREPLGTNKIGLKMLDERLNIVSDPCDPELPRDVFGFDGAPLTKVVWFEGGVLKNLEYTRAYAREKGRSPVLDPGGARLFAEGPTQTLEEMIASTRRGVWVNRLSNVTLMNRRTLLLTGTTRDGTFLIENGKVTKAIKNFRFTESPFFIFNKLEAAGEPIRASSLVVAPRLKVRDFDFTSLTDAV